MFVSLSEHQHQHQQQSSCSAEIRTAAPRFDSRRSALSQDGGANFERCSRKPYLEFVFFLAIHIAWMQLKNSGKGEKKAVTVSASEGEPGDFIIPSPHFTPFLFYCPLVDEQTCHPGFGCETGAQCAKAKHDRGTRKCGFCMNGRS